MNGKKVRKNVATVARSATLVVSKIRGANPIEHRQEKLRRSWCMVARSRFVLLRQLIAEVRQVKGSVTEISVCMVRHEVKKQSC
jgi:hypothetical protein